MSIPSSTFSAPISHPNGNAISVFLVSEARGMFDAHDRFLRMHGYKVCQFAWSPDLSDRIARAGPGLLILHIITLRQQLALALIRSQSELPGDNSIMVLSDAPDETECVLVLELGADDYVSDPCSPRALLARIRSLMRRRHLASVPRSQPQRPGNPSFGDWLYDSESRLLTNVTGASQRLSRAEHGVLTTLLSAPGQTVSRQALSERGDPAALRHARSVDIQISRLRQRFGSEVEIIRTVRGRGYRFVPDVNPCR